MVNDDNGPEAAYPGPADEAPDTGEGHGSGLERSPSEPRQDGDAEDTGKRPVDWDPPPGNPGSGQDGQVQRDNGSAQTDSLIDQE